MKRSVVRAVGLAAATVVVVGVMLTALQRFILFPTHAIPPVPAQMQPPAGTQRVDISIADGAVEGWFLAGDGVSGSRPGPVVFFAHGNGELIDYAAPGLRPYLRRGVSVALLEYRGYGRSAGSPSEEGIVGDLVRFYDAVVARADVDGARVVFHGRSLGGGAVLGLSRHRVPRALITESTFRSVAVLARGFLLPRFLVRDPFDNEAAIALLDFPVLLFHGTEDEIVPYDHATVLAGTARDARLVSFACGHNDLPPSQSDYWGEIDAYLTARGVLP